MATMVISSVTAYTPSGSTAPAEADVPVLRLEVVAAGDDTPYSCNQVIYQNASFDGGGLTPPNTATSARLYFTGSSPVFTTAGGVVDTGTTLTTNNTMNFASVQLTSGINYFWVAFDVSASASVCPTGYLESIIVSARFVGGAAGTRNFTVGGANDLVDSMSGNLPIQQPQNMSPIDLAVVPPTVVFSWDAPTFYTGNYSLYVETTPVPTAPIWAGATTSIAALAIPITLVEGDTYYWIVMTDGADPTLCTLNEFTVADCQRVSTQPTPIEVCSGTAQVLSMTAINATGYQWFKDSVPLSDGAVYSGTTTNTLTITIFEPSVDGDYWVEVYGGCNTVESDHVAVVALPTTTIVDVPTGGDVCQGTTTDITITATGSNLTYQWQSFDGTTWNNIVGQTTDTLAVVMVGNMSVRCVVTGDCGTEIALVGAIRMIAIPTIRGNPSNLTTCNGVSGIGLNATTGSIATFQWYQNGSPIANDPPRVINASGTAGIFPFAAQLRFYPIQPSDAGTYFCRFTNDCGYRDTTTATITVSPLPVITVPPVSVTALPGDNVTFEVTATNATSYQWYHNGVSLVGETTDTLNLTGISLADAGDYTCTVTNACGTDSASATLVTIPIVSDVCCFDSFFVLYAAVDEYWTGTGVVQNKFYPSVAGIGTHILTLHYAGGEVESNINVLDCDPFDAKVKLLNCCFADKVTEALKYKRQGLTKSSEKAYREAKFLVMALDLLRCYQVDADEVLPSWSIELTPTGVSGTASILWGADVIGTATGTDATLISDLVDSINTSDFIAGFDGNVITIIAPSCKYSGTLVGEVSGGVTITEEDNSFSGGTCEIINCITDEQVKNIWELVDQLCGCNCTGKDIVTDNVYLSSGRKYKI